MARPSLGPQIVAHLTGSAQAKQRLRVILQALCGQIDVPQACEQLGIGESRFHQLRNDTLQHALEALEPRPRGRPSVPCADTRIQELQQQVQVLALDLRASQIREELAIAMPHLARPPQPTVTGGEKKWFMTHYRGRLAGF
jgi:hypothetical protein